jgi:hypothetical protein
MLADLDLTSAALMLNTDVSVFGVNDRVSKQALALGLLKVRIEVQQQGPFDLEPSFSAFFAPQSAISRGETAVALSTLDTLR